MKVAERGAQISGTDVQDQARKKGRKIVCQRADSCLEKQKEREMEREGWHPKVGRWATFICGLDRHGGAAPLAASKSTSNTTRQIQLETSGRTVEMLGG